MIAVDMVRQAFPGASDADRDAWLAERRTGITATEVRDLYLEKLGKPSYTRRDELIGRKLGRIPEVGDLSHVPVIGWGNLREPIIAEKVRQRFAIEPESRVFRLVENPRKLASPDGIGADFDGALLLSEIKTAGVDVSPGSEAFEKKGYLFQCVWGMRILGARRCLYAWEERIEVAPGVFEPGELHYHWIEYDEVLAMALDALADEFLVDLASAASTEYVAPDFDDELDTMAVNYLRFIGEEKSAAAAKKREFEAIKKVLADRPRFSQKSALASITWTRGGSTTSTEMVERSVVDEAKAQALHKDTYAGLVAARKRAESAAKKAAEAEAAWAEILNGFTSTETAEVPVTKTTRENLTITAPKTKGME